MNKKLKLTYRPVDLPMKYVFTIANFSRSITPCVLVEIEYDGIIGYGEASLPPYLGETQDSVIAFLKQVNLEQFNDPFHLEDILTYVDKIAVNNAAAKASIDIAMHDLVGKLIGQPWYKIWGLDKSKTPSTSYTIGIDTEEVVKQKTLEVAGLYNIIKVKLGGADDKKMIEAIRSVTNLPITADANQGWKDKHYALDMIHWLREKGIVMVEQPLARHRIDDSAWITERSPLPVFADESFQRLTDLPRMKGAFDGVNIKLMKCTGMREAWKILNAARAMDMQTMVGCMSETSCAITAAAQLSPAVDWADLDGSVLIKTDLFKGMTVVNGKITIPDLPGIGATKL
jgi:L-alanine-DL-glutamate epimerase-like enolase superfamily enzyme